MAGATEKGMRSPMPEPLPFGRWLKRLRAERDLTQEALAEAAGCAAQTIRAFESGTRRPSRDLAERLAAVLQVPAEQQLDFVRAARTPASPPLTQPVAQKQDQPPGDDAGTRGASDGQVAPEPSPILATKLYLPRPRSVLVSRPRLLARLDAGLA